MSSLNKVILIGRLDQSTTGWLQARQLSPRVACHPRSVAPIKRPEPNDGTFPRRARSHFPPLSR